MNIVTLYQSDCGAILYKCKGKYYPFEEQLKEIAKMVADNPRGWGWFSKEHLKKHGKKYLGIRYVFP